MLDKTKLTKYNIIIKTAIEKKDLMTKIASQICQTFCQKKLYKEAYFSNFWLGIRINRYYFLEL